MKKFNLKNYAKSKNEIPVHPTTAYYIDKYIAWMEKIGRKIDETECLFQPAKYIYDGKMKKN